jgi:hypothetical protein
MHRVGRIVSARELHRRLGWPLDWERYRYWTSRHVREFESV